MRTTERVTVTLPVEQAERLRRAASEGDVASISAYVSQAVSRQLDRDASLAALGRLYAERGVGLGAEHHEWARRILGVAGNGSEAAVS